MQAKQSDRASDKEVRRTDIWWVSAGPVMGGKTDHNCPCVVVSNDGSNRHLDRIQVLPLASNEGRVYPCDAVITLGRQRWLKAVADQIMTIPTDQLISKVGRVGKLDMANVDRAIRLQLGLTQLRRYPPQAIPIGSVEPFFEPGEPSSAP